MYNPDQALKAFSILRLNAIMCLRVLRPTLRKADLPVSDVKVSPDLRNVKE